MSGWGGERHLGRPMPPSSGLRSAASLLLLVLVLLLVHSLGNQLELQLVPVLKIQSGVLQKNIHFIEDIFNVLGIFFSCLLFVCDVWCVVSHLCTVVPDAWRAASNRHKELSMRGLEETVF